MGLEIVRQSEPRCRVRADVPTTLRATLNAIALLPRTRSGGATWMRLGSAPPGSVYQFVVLLDSLPLGPGR